ncbi:MAG: tetratricopeptide repeat protein [Candidatus Melainabacteria bacterium]|nr:tetratricopeptide repeat protein [Candidatus Melainabacteria bacterium]
MLLSSCAEKKEAPPISAEQAEHDKTSKELDRLFVSPPQLSLSEALKKYTPGKKASSMSSAELTFAAITAADMSDNEAAETMLNQAIKLDDKNSMAYYQRGRVRGNAIAGKDSDAMADLKKAISLGHVGGNAHVALARLYDANNQPKEAIEQLTKAITLDPMNKDVYKARAALYVSVGEKEKAIKDYDKLAAIDPKSLTTHFQKAQVEESMKKFDDAIGLVPSLVEKFGDPLQD